MASTAVMIANARTMQHVPEQMVPATVPNQDGQGCSAIVSALGGRTGSTVFVSANVEMEERVIARQVSFMYTYLWYSCVWILTSSQPSLRIDFHCHELNFHVRKQNGDNVWNAALKRKSATRIKFYVFARLSILCLYFIYARRICVRTLVKNLCRWKSTLTRTPLEPVLSVCLSGVKWIKERQGPTLVSVLPRCPSNRSVS